MKKIIFVMMFMIFITFTGCQSAEVNDFNPDEDESGMVILADDIPNRKIVYEVNLSMNVTQLNEAILDVTSRLESDEWFDKESISGSAAYYTIRIKTSRLDAFINGLKESYATSHYEKTGTDISLQYQDKSNRILAIESQIDRLNDLYATASLSDMIVINEQLSELEIELQRLNGELLVFDSLVDYSEVNLSLHASSVTTKSPFFNRLGQSFEQGFNGLIQFFDGLIMVIATVLPFAIVFGGVGTGVIYLVKRHNKKLDLKKQDKDSNTK